VCRALDVPFEEEVQRALERDKPAVRVYAAGTPARVARILPFKTILGDFRERRHGALEGAKDDPEHAALE
jgi:hypothetical protein